MADNKKTILDVVKSVREKELLREVGDVLEQPYKYEFLGPNLKDMTTINRLLKGEPRRDLSTQAIEKEYKEIPSLAGRAMLEEAPTAGGTYKGSVYYSNILPQDEDRTPWTKEASNIISKAAKANAKKSDVLAAQNYFVDIGYMHPSEVDGYKGKQLLGMISRWNLNAGTSKEAMFDAMDTWKDDLFNHEEDLREGGGDQGPY